MTNNFFNQNTVNQETSVVSTVQNFFNETFGEVRGSVINGTPYVVGADIAKCLGYTNPWKALIDHVSEQNKLLDEPNDSLGSSQIAVNDSMGRTQHPQFIFINEAGINELIFSSRMPKAKELQQWISGEVMPQLRQYGMYFDHPILQQYGKNPEEAMKNIEAYINRQQNIIDEQQERINRMKPKEDIYDHLIYSQGFNNATSIAADFGMSVRDFNHLLASLGIQRPRFGTPKWVLDSKYEGKGYTIIQEGFDENGNHFYFMAWTNKGREFLYNILRDYGYYPVKPNTCPFDFRF